MREWPPCFVSSWLWAFGGIAPLGELRYSCPMTNVLIIAGLLLIPYGMLALARVPSNLRGRISLAAVFTFTGVGHFVKTSEMAQMLPVWVPEREWIVYFTGALELLAAAALLAPATSRIAGIFLCFFLVAVFPANVFAALERVEFGGHGAGPVYLAVRLPLQLLLLGWTWWFAVRRQG
jgi:uncharacterized membrane protein